MQLLPGRRISKYRLEIAGMVCGALAGFAYHHYIGCNSGSCPITSNPYISTGYGAVMGGLLLSIFKKQPEKRK